MRTHRTLSLQGYTVQGSDLRDNSHFEDFCVGDNMAQIEPLYEKKGYSVENVIPQETVEITLDLLDLYHLAKKRPEETAVQENYKPKNGNKSGQRPKIPTIKPERVAPQGEVNANKIAAAEKKVAHAKLIAYREKHGLGCIEHIVKASKGTISGSIIRDMLTGEKQVIENWRIVGAALDKLVAAEQERAG